MPSYSINHDYVIATRDDNELSLLNLQRSDGLDRLNGFKIGFVI